MAISTDYDSAGNYIPLALRGRPAPACDVCQDAGFVVPAVPVGDPRFGRSILCPACNGGQVVEAQRQKQRAAALDILRRYGLTESKEHDWLTWEHFTARALGHYWPDKALAAAIVRDWADGEPLQYSIYGEAFARSAPTTFRFEPSVSAWLFGPVGTGKTALAYLAYKTRLSRSGEVGVFVEWTALYSSIRASYGSRGGDNDQAHELVQAIGNVPVLLLDDVGQQHRARMSDDEYEKLWLILNQRYAQQLPTLITSNLDYDALLERTDDKLASRVGQRYVLVPVGGANLRTVR